MPGKRQRLPPFVLVAMVALGGPPLVVAADLSTLFTTPQERQFINSNRYRNNLESVTVEIKADGETEAELQRRLMEEVTYDYEISGITLSPDGPHTVWINNVAYEDGEQLPDTSKIRIIAEGEIRVSITAPDGAKFSATSGQSLQVTYLAPIEERL